MKHLAATVLAFSLAVGIAMGQDTTSSTQESTSTQRAKTKRNKSGGETAINNQICPVSGQDVNAMGNPITVVHKGQKVTLCCDMCKDKFKADPDNMLEKAKASAKK
ncbi:MAG: hypothetical protein ACR2IE_12585 [Candidatus Sumerlaeaceae bacterium]